MECTCRKSKVAINLCPIHGDRENLDKYRKRLSQTCNNLAEAVDSWTDEYMKIKTELEEHRWIPVEEGLPEKVEYYAVTDGLEWWREMWCFVDHSGSMGWEDNPDCITHYRYTTLPGEMK